MSKDSHRTVVDLVDDIVTWGDRIPGFIGDATFDQFQLNDVLHLAVWKCVEVVGEASSRLLKTDFASGDTDLRNELRQASDMRNRLTHGYPGVDLAILWTTARQFVPGLIAKVRRSANDGDGCD